MIAHGNITLLENKGIKNMTKDELIRWWELREQVVNGWHMSKADKTELLQLNHKVMEASRNIHNDNMLDKNW